MLLLDLQTKLAQIRDEDTSQTHQSIREIHWLKKEGDMELAKAECFDAWQNSMSSRKQMQALLKRIQVMQKEIGEIPAEMKAEFGEKSVPKCLVVAKEAIGLLDQLYTSSWNQVLNNYKAVQLTYNGGNHGRINS